MFRPFWRRSVCPRTRYADEDTWPGIGAAASSTTAILKRTLIGLMVWDDQCVARLERDVEFGPLAPQHRVIIERQLILPSVFVAQHVNLLSLGIIGKAAGLTERLHHRHPVGK